MEYNELIDQLKRLLNQKYGEHFDYATEIAEKLQIDVRTAKRKLKGEARFTAVEVLEIAKKFSLSLDHIYRDTDAHFPLQLHNYDVRPELFWNLIDETVNIYESASQSETSHFMLACNPIPVVFWTQSEWLSKFMYLQWEYNRGNDVHPTSFKEIGAKEKYKATVFKLLDSTKKIKLSTFVLPENMIKQTVDTILYYYTIKLITPEEIKYLYEDLRQLLKYMETICKLGFYPETENEIRFFISYKPIPIDLNIVESNNINVGIMFAMQLYPTTTLNPQTFTVFKKWFKSIVRASELISQSNEAECSKYFSLQREEIKNLLTIIQ